MLSRAVHYKIAALFWVVSASFTDFLSREADTRVERVSIKNDSKSKRALTNEQIEAPMVRLIDADGSQVGIVSNAEAMEKADAAGMDLVMMADGETPVCKIMDYGKHILKQRSKKRLRRRRPSAHRLKK